MGRPRPRSVVLLLTLIYGLSGAPLWAGTTEPHSVFQAFTSYIQRQVEADKQLFVDASSCTEWVYKRERDKSREPRAEGIALRPSRPGPDAPDAPNAMGTERVSSIDCRSRYPRGLEGAREDFSRTQSTLSLSLTFYEFALVGDRDDDNQREHDGVLGCRRTIPANSSALVNLPHVVLPVATAAALLRLLQVKQPGFCQKCGYNLRGLTKPRCPECSTEFDPSTIPSQPIEMLIH